jgi:alkylation response protein AidB-like acyl-CoA dehydrogenase
MDFEWTPEQREYRDSVVKFAQNRLSRGVIERDVEHAFSREAWKACAEIGIQGLPVPEEYGGSAADATTIVLALEGLGYGCRDNGLMFALGAQMWACEVPLVKFGSEAQKRRYLPPLCTGSLIGAQAISEPDAGSDAFSLTTTADRRNGRYVLNGRKTFVTNAPEADVLLVYASTDPGASFAGLSAFLIERDQPGLSVGRPLHKMGLRTSPMSELFLDDCELDEQSLLGKAGSGMSIFNLAMLWERSCILACVVGVMQRQLERCVTYAKQRKQFDRPIGEFQAVGHRLADMKVRLETARLLIYHLAHLLDRGRAKPDHAAIAKLHVSECFVQSSLDALQIHGGYGYMTEYELERDVRDALASRIHSGTSDMQRNLITRFLGL